MTIHVGDFYVWLESGISEWCTPSAVILNRTPWVKLYISKRGEYGVREKIFSFGQLRQRASDYLAEIVYLSVSDFERLGLPLPTQGQFEFVGNCRQTYPKT